MAILKLARLLRINRIILMMRTDKETKAMLKLAKLMFYLFLYVHLWACFWFYQIKDSLTWLHPLQTIYPDRNVHAEYFYN